MVAGAALFMSPELLIPPHPNTALIGKLQKNYDRNIIGYYGFFD